MGDGDIVGGIKEVGSGGKDVADGAGDASKAKDKAGAGGEHITGGLTGLAGGS